MSSQDSKQHQPVKFHPVTHVIFDCDGLLVNSEYYYSEAITTVAAKYGKQFTPQIKREMMGKAPQRETLNY